MARYHVIVESPLGERGGTLILYERGGAVTGTLSLLGVNNPVTGSREGETLTLRHTLQTALNAFAYETRLRDEGAVLRGVITDKYVTISENVTLMGHERYPIVIAKGATV